MVTDQVAGQVIYYGTFCKNVKGKERLTQFSNFFVLFKTSIEVDDSTVFNQPWQVFFERTGTAPNEIWSPDIVRVMVFFMERWPSG